MLEDLTTGANTAPMRSNLRQIEPLLAKLRDKFQPLQIWLFGSRARGDARDDSDWDLVVVVPNTANPDVFDPRAPGRLLREGGWGADIVVMAEADFEEDLFTVNTVPFAARTEGFRLDER
jgi:predicted nucleotidyltransferase